ncbi:MAG: arginine--tRNA ligase, partial [Muribaculaceae bacterium]|nr:arginine--tRNA ligase [Muribaculaceae bacterium]
MSIDKVIASATAKAVQALYNIEADPDTIVPQATRKEFEGNLTVMVFPWVKAARKAPEAVGREIGEWLVLNEPAVSAYNVVKGFLNIVVTPTYWNSVLSAIEADEHYGVRKATAESPLVMIEYSSPNTNKPLHLGHMRNILLGSSLANILESCGNRVVKTNIVNDRGIHICKSMLAWQRWFDGATPESLGKKGDHLVGDCYVSFDQHYRAELNELMAKGMSKEEAEAAS